MVRKIIWLLKKKINSQNYKKNYHNYKKNGQKWKKKKLKKTNAIKNKCKFVIKFLKNVSNQRSKCLCSLIIKPKKKNIIRNQFKNKNLETV